MVPERSVPKELMASFICIGFAFKRDIVVGLPPIAACAPSNCEFDGVPQKKGEYQKFGLLLQMNFLMGHERHIVAESCIAIQNEGKNSDAAKSAGQ